MNHFINDYELNETDLKEYTSVFTGPVLKVSLAIFAVWTALVVIQGIRLNKPLIAVSAIIPIGLYFITKNRLMYYVKNTWEKDLLNRRIHLDFSPKEKKVTLNHEYTYQLKDFDSWFETGSFMILTRSNETSLLVKKNAFIEGDYDSFKTWVTETLKLPFKQISLNKARS